MPNEGSYGYKPAAHPIGVANISIPGLVVAGTFRGRRLPVPIHMASAAMQSRAVQHLRRGDPTKYGTLRIGLSSSAPAGGIGSWGAGFASVGSSIASAVSSFASAFSSVIETIVQVVSDILSFVVDTVVAVVSAVLGAVGSLVQAVVDSITLKNDGDLSTGDAVQMGTFLYAKYQSLQGADQPNILNRSMTPEEKSGYNRQMQIAKDGILTQLASGAAAVVSKLGGSTNTLILGAAVAGAVYILGG